ncbi:MAG: hypothetical protein LC808_02520 [Actinobacteria bacterium]|nr:hypothetical protein [Actinomycetota bacterium]
MHEQRRLRSGQRLLHAGVLRRVARAIALVANPGRTGHPLPGAQETGLAPPLRRGPALLGGRGGRHSADAAAMGIPLLSVAYVAYLRAGHRLVHREALSKAVVILVELEELVTLFERELPLIDLLRPKLQAAILEKNPLVYPLR